MNLDILNKNYFFIQKYKIFKVIIKNKINIDITYNE
jgi:hypothetical protein